MKWLGSLGAYSIGMAAAALGGAALWRMTGVPFSMLPIALVLAWVSFRNWRLGILAGTIYMTVAGSVSIWLSPSSLPYFFKDFLFIFPAMAGFIVSGEKRKPGQGQFPWFTTLAFAGIVLLECLNPHLSSPVMALLGVKVWLGYVPLFILGRNFLRSLQDLRQALWALLISSAAPTLYGLWEFFAVRQGGFAEGTRPGEFAGGYLATEFDIGYYRISSLFASSTQFEFYLLFMAVVGGAVLILERHHRVARSTAALLLALVIINAGIDGDRKLFFSLPFLLMAFTFFEKDTARRVRAQVLGIVTSVLALIVLGVPLLLRLHSVADVFDDRVHVMTTSFGEAIVQAPLGLGTGMATGPAVHINPDRIFVETLPAKTVYELGMLGLILLILFYGSTLVTSVLSVQSCGDPLIRSVAMLFTLYVATVMLSSAYGWPLDLDPSNVTGWLTLGWVAGMPNLTTTALVS